MRIEEQIIKIEEKEKEDRILNIIEKKKLIKEIHQNLN